MIKVALHCALNKSVDNLILEISTIRLFYGSTNSTIFPFSVVLNLGSAESVSLQGKRINGKEKMMSMTYT